MGSYLSLPADEAETDPNYRSTLEWIWSFSARLRSPRDMAAQRAVKLERMWALLGALGHPQERFPSLLVAGTKGKGSTVAMLSACLRAAGYRTGRYTSPHLLNWRERTWVDGSAISTDEVLALVEPIKMANERLSPRLGPLTTFEVGTAFALLHFARKNVDVAVLEVGTGGRFDATNLVEPHVSAIAPVSYDHTQTLGSTLTSIAWHKAGIMRPGRPAVSAPQPTEARVLIETEAKLIGAHLEEVGREWRWSPSPAEAATGVRIEATHDDFAPLDLDIGLLGDHQRDNATTAVATLHAIRRQFPVEPSEIVSALKNVDWPGRLQVLSRDPLLVLDGAHNRTSADVVQHALRRVFDFDRLLLVVGLTEGKDAMGVLSSLAPPSDEVFLTRSHHERSASPAQLASVVRSVAPHAHVATYADASGALEAALRDARPRDLVLVTGSLFLVGEALEWRRRSSR